MLEVMWRVYQLRARFWLWRHDGHAHRDLTGSMWRCSCGSRFSRLV